MKKKTEEELLKNHVCLQPFRHIEMFHDHASLCCGTWLHKHVWYPTEDGVNFDYNVWNSEAAQEIRKSVSDGSYRYCSRDLCPHLNTLISTGKSTGMFARVDTPSVNEFKWEGEQQYNFPFTDLEGITIEGEYEVKATPGSINFTFDRSCNLKCPSCRLDTIMAKPDEVARIDKLINFINEKYAHDCRKITITGSGDPFASKSFRRFLFNFNPNQWTKLKKVYLVTNGILFTKKIWDKMKNVQPYITEVEISIDAGTKDTYENKTRLGGNWDVLIENLKFVSKIDTIKNLRISFVVQTDNYKEMARGAYIASTLFKDRIKNSGLYENTTLYFGRIAQWGHMSYHDIKQKDVANPSHPEHEEFKKSLLEAYQYSDKIYIQSNLTGFLPDSHVNKQ
jgi:sulfatase maturation enzyme AslB (radical SAM superfamily)